jgi:hypothetical protein
MIEGSTRISSGMAVKQLAAKGSKGAGASQQPAADWLVRGTAVVCKAIALVLAHGRFWGFTTCRHVRHDHSGIAQQETALWR